MNFNSPIFFPAIFLINPVIAIQKSMTELIREIFVLFSKFHIFKNPIISCYFPISPVIKIYFFPVYFLSLILYSFQNLIGFIDLMELDKLNSSLPAVAREK